MDDQDLTPDPSPPADPLAPSMHLSRADTLLRQGRTAEAERELARACELAPRNTSATALRARALLALNRRDDALRAIEASIDSGADVPASLLLLRAQILLGASRFAEAAAAFGQAIAAEPGNGAAELGRAVALGECGQGEAAAAAAGNAIAKGHDTPGARFVLGRALFQSHRIEEAEHEFRRVLRDQPMHVAAHTNLADLLWMRTGDIATSTAMLDVALRQAPSAKELRIVKSRLLDAAGESEHAYAEIAAALAFDPHSADLNIAATRISVKFDGTLALDHGQRALKAAPDDPHSLESYLDAALAAGCADDALAIAERLLRMNPRDGHALAIKASALRMLGDPRYRELYDYDRFVRTSVLDTPAGWPDLDAYLADLAQSLHAKHDAMNAHPVTQSLRHGTQVELSPDREQAAIRAFPQAIDGAIRRYVEAIGDGDDPLRSRRSGSYRLSEIWSVRLGRSGHHVNHFHGKGWLSSACYIELPDRAALAAGAGWLRFGEPFMATNPPLPAEYFVRPEPGLLVLFPSWMWHGTVPFVDANGRSRLTVAFDVVPG